QRFPSLPARRQTIRLPALDLGAFESDGLGGEEEKGRGSSAHQELYHALHRGDHADRLGHDGDLPSFAPRRQGRSPQDEGRRVDGGRVAVAAATVARLLLFSPLYPFMKLAISRTTVCCSWSVSSGKIGKASVSSAARSLSGRLPRW